MEKGEWRREKWAALRYTKHCIEFYLSVLICSFILLSKNSVKLRVTLW